VITATDPQHGYIQSVTMQLLLSGSREIISFPFFDSRMEDIRDLTRRMKQARYWQKKIQYYLYVPASHENV
jgi:hypothetical protein